MAASLGSDFGRLVDPHGGRADLENETIRVLHDRSFVDDPTRIFRAIRYESRLGFRMDEETARLAREGVAGVAPALGRARCGRRSLRCSPRTRRRAVARPARRVRGRPPGSTPRLVERLDALRGELDPDAPLWRCASTAVAAAHPGLVERLSLRRRGCRGRSRRQLALAPRAGGGDRPVEIAGSRRPRARRRAARAGASRTRRALATGSCGCATSGSR